MDSTWNLKRIFQFCQDEEKMIEYFMERGVLKRNMGCPQCGESMKRNKSLWRCQRMVKTKKGKN